MEEIEDLNPVTAEPQGGASRSLWSAGATVTSTFMRGSKPPPGAVKMT
jgi:hypothetical protein